MPNFKYTYDYIKEYIESFGCRLLTERKVIGTKEKLKVLCSCKGTVFYPCFYNFKKGVKLCKHCIAKIEGKKYSSNFIFIKDEFKKRGYFWENGEYKNNKSKISFIDETGYKYYSSYIELLQANKKGGNLDAFYFRNIYVLENIRLWLQINNKPFNLINTDCSSYKGNKENNLLFKCNKCDETWNCCWSYVQQNHSCPYCKGKRIGESNNLKTLFPDLCKEWNYNKNDINPNEVGFSYKKKVWWICSLCGCEWEASVKSRSQNGTGCIFCNNSKGENEIRKFLTAKNILFKFQKRFDNCKNERALPFDFYLFDYNLAIEYQGSLHFLPVEKFGGKIALDRIKKHDSIKKEFCKNENINFLEIPYWDFNNIESILSKELNITT